MRIICIVTGSRAEYGHLRWLARIIEDDPESDLQWIVTGAHLREKFGLTYREIEADGFDIHEKVEIDLFDDTNLSVANAVGMAVGKLAESLDRLKPEIVVILGDRYEMMAAAMAATIMRVPIAHIHGGEITEGAMDESFRHAISKMAHLHFAAAEAYRKRIVQLGEAPARVILSGAPGIDFLGRIELPNLGDLSKRAGQKLREEFFLVTYHPVTLGIDDLVAVTELTKAIDEFPDRMVLITGVNADPKSDFISDYFRDYSARNSERVAVIESLGQTFYLGAIALSAAVVGNSSSGMLEAPILGTPTLNIGDRQKGRLRANSVVDCDPSREAIRDGLLKCLDLGFREKYCDGSSPYLIGNASNIIADTLRQTNAEDLKRKQFYDLIDVQVHHVV